MVYVPQTDMPVVSQRLVDGSARQRSARHPRVRDRAHRSDEPRVQGVHRRRRLRNRAVLAGSEIHVPRAGAVMAEARKRFVDTTGRPGPAGWELSTYPRGQDDLPVVGISWYEAVAYARFRKQMLPTIHHWMRAAFTPYEPMFPTAAAITKQSRFFADTPESARSEHGARAVGHVSHGRQRARVGLEFRRRRCSCARQRLARVRVELCPHLYRGPDGAAARPRLAADAHAG